VSGVGPINMYYVYVLKSYRDKLFYIGFTTNIEDRVDCHSKGAVPATKYRRPVKLIFYEAFMSQKDATRREKYFKTTKGKAALKIMLKDCSLNQIIRPCSSVG